MRTVNCVRWTDDVRSPTPKRTNSLERRRNAKWNARRPECRTKTETAVRGDKQRSFSFTFPSFSVLLISFVRLFAVPTVLSCALPGDDVQQGTSVCHLASRLNHPTGAGVGGRATAWSLAKRQLEWHFLALHFLEKETTAAGWFELHCVPVHCSAD